MKKIIFILTFSSIFSLLGCKSEEEKFLENHEVFPCSPKIVQEKKYRISIKKANDLYIKYLYDRKEIKDLDYDETLLSPTLIVDDHYVYSFQNLVMQKVAVFGIWINANTGEITTYDKSIWLKEKDIVSFKK
jgi:lipoprotein